MIAYYSIYLLLKATLAGCSYPYGIWVDVLPVTVLAGKLPRYFKGELYKELRLPKARVGSSILRELADRFESWSLETSPPLY